MYGLGFIKGAGFRVYHGCCVYGLAGVQGFGFIMGVWFRVYHGCGV